MVGLGLAQSEAAIRRIPCSTRFSFLGHGAGFLADPLSRRRCLPRSRQQQRLHAHRSRRCGNEGRAPHNLQGTFLLFGDLYTKAGRLPEARGYYNLGLRFAGAETWQFRTLSEARLATLDARAALYADADPSNDPLIVGAGPEACAYCHYR